MFAILISEENMPKIRERDIPAAMLDTLHIYQSHHKNWYLVTGYVADGGRYIGPVVFPAYVLKRSFEFDAKVIKSDWDQIVYLQED